VALHLQWCRRGVQRGEARDGQGDGEKREGGSSGDTWGGVVCGVSMRTHSMTCVSAHGDSTEPLSVMFYVGNTHVCAKTILLLYLRRSVRIQQFTHTAFWLLGAPA